MDKPQKLLADTLEVLEGDVWPAPDKSVTSLVKHAHALRKKKMSELDVSDYRFLLTQQMGVQFVLPLALDSVIRDPFLEAEFYPGDLLMSILNLPIEALEMQKKKLSDLAEELYNIRILWDNKSMNYIETQQVNRKLESQISKFVTHFTLNFSPANEKPV